MKILGIDPSSACGGHAIADGDHLVEHAVWKPSKAAVKQKGATRIFEYYRWLDEWLAPRAGELDLAAIEDQVVMRGAKTARILAHFEAIAIVVVKIYGLPLVRVKAGEARNIVLGMNPNSPKEQVLEALRLARPDLSLPPKNQGGPDVADAFVLTQAAPVALER